MLNRIRKITSASSFLVVVTSALFLFSKFKFSRPAPRLVKPAPPIAVEVVQVPEVLPLERAFSKQLNRGQSQIVKVLKKSPRLAKLTKKRKSKKPRTHRADLKIKKENTIVLAKLAETGFEESPLGSAFNIDPYESELRLDPGFGLDSLYPREQPLNLVEGVLVANDFQELKDSVKDFSQVPTLATAIQAGKEEKEDGDSISSPTLSANDLQAASQDSEAPSVNTQVSKASVIEAPSAAEQHTNLNNQMKPLQAAPAEVDTLIASGKNLLQTMQKKTVPNRDANRNVVPGVDTLPVTTQPVGKVYGKITFDPLLRDWVDAGKGHVELKLQRVGSSEPQDTFFVEYRYPERDFSWDGTDVKGQYQLVASFFKPEQSVSIAQVTYPQILNEQSAKQMVVFYIKKQQVDEAMQSSRASFQNSVVLSGTVFEATSGDHQSAQALPNAEVEVVGMPEWGVFKVDSMGTFRIPYVTAHSEYILSVRASGFYPTQVVVPTFQATGYVSVYLISKDKVDTITRFFTKKPQSEEKSIVMGRVFSPSNRAPVADQEILLSGRNGRALYFGVFPDPSLTRTTETGLFAFLNVEPGFRSLGRTNTTAWDLIGMKPNHAYYLETGRGGKSTLRGVLKDPYQNIRVAGLVKVVGSPYQVETNEKGEFELTDIELAPGLITLEVEARGYPMSWHNISWSARESRKVYTLYLPEEDLLEEARQTVAKTNRAAHTGTVFGGAEKRFFQGQNSCVFVSLETTEGQKVSQEHGPFPLNNNEDQNNGKLCLSKERPGFSFYNLSAGQYLLKWKNQTGKILRSHVVRVGSDRATILVN